MKWAKTDEDIRQERNIDFVARTRAIDKLEYVMDWSAFKPKNTSKHAEILNTLIDPDQEIIFDVDNLEDFH